MQTIKDILEEHRVPHVGADHKHGREGWVQVDCPWCGTGTGKYHLGISLFNGAAACWRCGRKNTAAVISKIAGIPQGVARKRIDGATMEAAPVRHTGTLRLPAGRGPLGPAHNAYLAKRGFSPALVADMWGVEGLGHAGKKPGGGPLKWRLFIPIYHFGEIISWTTRAVGRDRQRYMSAGMEDEALPHKQILYGADYASHAIIIHEGPLDVWAVGPGAVATCGTGFTEAQLLAMSMYAVRVVCFDNEPEAQRRARELANALSVYPGTTHNVQLETGSDPAEAEAAEIDELRATFLE